MNKYVFELAGIDSNKVTAAEAAVRQVPDIQSTRIASTARGERILFVEHPKSENEVLLLVQNALAGLGIIAAKKIAGR